MSEVKTIEKYHIKYLIEEKIENIALVNFRYVNYLHFLLQINFNRN